MTTKISWVTPCVKLLLEKAGILKPNTPVVVAQQLPEAREVILKRARELGCPVVETNVAYRIHEKSVSATQARSESVPAGSVTATIVEVSSGWSLDISPSLPGHFQVQNALNAVAAARVLSVVAYRSPTRRSPTASRTPCGPDAWKNCKRIRMYISMARIIPPQLASWRHFSPRISRHAKSGLSTERCETNPWTK